MKFAVGSLNKAKLSAVKQVVCKVFPCKKEDSKESKEAAKEQKEHEIVGCDVQSGVSAQPMSAAECLQGATNRAKAAMKATPSADFAIGLEGGLEKVGEIW